MNVYEVIKRPLDTEKTADRFEWENQYTFEVALGANKPQIKQAVETLFEVDVINVRTMIVKGKTRRWGRNYFQTQSWKKAIVTLAEGDTITHFEGV